MKIAYFSDVHFEFWWRHDDNLLDKIAKKCNESGADIVINVGDTHPNKKGRDYLRNLITLPYYETLGNHDYYNNQFNNQVDIHQLPNGMKLMNCTLWTNFRDDHAMAQMIYNKISDQQLIVGGSSAETLMHSYYDVLNNIEKEQPDIIASHFMPFVESIAPQYQNDQVLNKYFCNDLDSFVIDLPKKPKLWLCGHTHWKHEYIKHGIQVACNPLGYPGENFFAFDRDADNRYNPSNYNPMIIEVDDENTKE